MRAVVAGICAALSLSVSAAADPPQSPLRVFDGRPHAGQIVRSRWTVVERGPDGERVLDGTGWVWLGATGTPTAVVRFYRTPGGRRRQVSLSTFAAVLVSTGVPADADEPGCEITLGGMGLFDMIGELPVAGYDEQSLREGGFVRRGAVWERSLTRDGETELERFEVAPSGRPVRHELTVRSRAGALVQERIESYQSTDVLDATALPSALTFYRILGGGRCWEG